MKNKKTKIAIIGIIALILVTIGLTYAYWLVTKTQNNENVISSGCLNVSISSEANDIALSNQFPISDEDGMKLVPYTFTVTNNCNTSVDYQIALEAIGEESASISSKALKVALNDNAGLLSSYAEVDTTVEGAYEARRLGFSRLSAKGSEGDSDSYELRIWIDEEASISEMNKTFKSKISVTIGQGIEAPYEEGTLAYSILSNYGGTEAITELKANEYVHGIASYGSSNGSNSNTYGTSYTYDETTSQYTLSGDLVEATYSECRAGKKTDGTTITCGQYYISGTGSTSSKYMYKVVDFSDTYVISGSLNYTNIFKTMPFKGESSLHKAQDDLGTSYYFRGDVENNYIKFGKFSENGPVIGYYDSISTSSSRRYANMEECTNATSFNVNCSYIYESNDDMYWRIVRINGDGSIRMIYAGTYAAENGSAYIADIGTGKFNADMNDIKYIGYTYDSENGTQVDSTVKTTIETWYENNLENDYGSYIADGIFCNDRQVTSSDNYGTYFGSYDRLRNYSPVLMCENQSDRYTMNDTTNGNGLLSKPVGLITADEMAMAGIKYGNYNEYTYLSSYQSYLFTMSPASYNSYGANVVGVDLADGLTNYSGSAIRPVINLKADVKVTGKGTMDSPYEIVTE